jgi:hypothetical protein
MAKYNLFVGSENGTFKGLNTASNTFSNLNDIKSLNKQKEILKLCWKNAELQDEVCLIKSILKSSFK